MITWSSSQMHSNLKCENLLKVSTQSSPPLSSSGIHPQVLDSRVRKLPGWLESRSNICQPYFRFDELYDYPIRFKFVRSVLIFMHTRINFYMHGSLNGLDNLKVHQTYFVLFPIKSDHIRFHITSPSFLFGYIWMAQE